MLHPFIKPLKLDVIMIWKVILLFALSNKTYSAQRPDNSKLAHGKPKTINTKSDDFLP